MVMDGYIHFLSTSKLRSLIRGPFAVTKDGYVPFLIPYHSVMAYDSFLSFFSPSCDGDGAMTSLCYLWNHCISPHSDKRVVIIESELEGDGL